jgi:hypothetical protein
MSWPAAFDALSWSWLTLLLLGAFHGINPGMGWLFAVALGMQERRASAVWAALLPLAAGHALAILVVVLLAFGAGVVVPDGVRQVLIAGLLMALGIRRLIRQRHPRWGGMRVGARGLMMWSFLMASAHGAGLMVLPVMLNMASSPAAHHAHGASAGTGAMMGFAASGVHAAAYLFVTALVAWVVFEKVGLGLLRRGWVNMDRIWAMSLVVTGAATFFI